MKFSACCTIRIRTAVLAFFAPLLLSAAVVAQVADTTVGTPPAAEPAQSTADLVQQNSLRGEAKPAFHAKLALVIFDDSERISEQGTLEYWWDHAAGSYLTATSPSLGTTHNLSVSEVSNDKARRVAFLAARLLEDFLSPAAPLGPPGAKVESEQRAMGSSTLRCLHRVLPDVAGHLDPPEQACIDPATGTVRALLGQNLIVIRNRTGAFGKTHVSQEITRLYLGRKAVQGTVLVLQSFNPSQENVPLQGATNSATPVLSESAEVFSPEITAAKKIDGRQPEYPLTARSARVSGSVLLGAVITTEGRVADLFELASDSPLLTGASLDAVRTWTYSPLLLNGRPKNLETTLVVNFNLHVNH